MTLNPTTVDSLSAALAQAHAARQKINSVNLSGLPRVLEHRPEEMVATVSAGVTCAEFQSALKKAGQWLPCDPALPEERTIADLVHDNLSGPRRFAFGSVREWLIGISAVTPEGRLIRGGGKVVKNVAGYDLPKLLVGSRMTLAVVVEATFKLLPVPEKERFFIWRVANFDAAETLLQTIRRSSLTPHILDLHNIGIAEGGFCLVLGLSGTEAEINLQLPRLPPGSEEVDETVLQYETRLWSGRVQRETVLPSSLVQALKRKGAGEFVTRAGNGIIYRPASSVAPPIPFDPGGVGRRLKTEFDPHNVLPVMTCL